MPKPSEKLIQINTRRQVHLERNKTHEQSEYLPFLEQMRFEVKDRLFSNDVPEMTRRRLENMLKGLSASIKNIQVDYKDVWLSQIKQVYESDVEFQVEALNIATDLDYKLPAPKQLESAVFTNPLSVEGIHGGKILDTFFDDIMQADVNRVVNAIRQGYAQGETTQAITARVLGLARNRFRDGVFDKFEKSARMLVRTSLHHSSQMARQSLYSENKQIIKSVVIVATLDGKTSVYCRSLDGRRFPVDSGPRPPFHAGCRTTFTAEFDSRFKFLQEDATRSVRGEDGVTQVDANQTYYSWLKKESTEFQDSAIGPKWAKLLRDGGLSSERFSELRLDKTFQPLTLAQVKELEPTAFNRAGL